MSSSRNPQDSFTIMINTKTSNWKNYTILPPVRNPRPQKDSFQQIQVEVHEVDYKFAPSSLLNSITVPPLRKKKSLSELALNVSQDRSQRQIMGSLSSLDPPLRSKLNEKKRIALDGNVTKGLNLKESECDITSSMPDIRKVSCNGRDFLDNLESGCQCVNKGESTSNKSEAPLPGSSHDVSFSSPEISDVVVDDLMSNSHFLHHRASVILVSEDLVLPVDKPMAPYRKTPHLKKKSYTFTQGDSYLQEVRSRIKDKSKTRSVTNLIRRTFSFRDLRRSNDVPCLPNLLKRYRQKKNMKKEENYRLPSINEDSNLQGTPNHSFASIFIRDDENDSYLEQCAKSADLNCSCSSVRFPDNDYFGKSTSSIDVFQTLNKPLKNFGSKSSLPCIHNDISRKRFLNHLPQDTSTVSLNQEALKRAHELLNKSIKSKNVHKGPIPPKRTSKSNLAGKSLNTGTDSSMASSVDLTDSTKSKMGLSEDIFKTILSPFTRGNVARSKNIPAEQESSPTIKDKRESDSKKTINSLPTNGLLSKKATGNVSLHYSVGNRQKRKLIKRHTDPHIILSPSISVSNENTNPRQEEVIQKFLRRYSYDVQALEVIKDVYNETYDDTPVNIWQKSLDDIKKIGNKALWGSDIGCNSAFKNIKSYRTPEVSQNLDGASPQVKLSSSQLSIPTGTYDLNYNDKRLTELEMLNSLEYTEGEDSKESCEVFSFPWNKEFKKASQGLKQSKIVSEDASAKKSGLNFDDRNFTGENSKNKISDRENQVPSTIPGVYFSRELKGKSATFRERLNSAKSISDHLNTCPMLMVSGGLSPLSGSKTEASFVTHADVNDVDKLGKEYEREIFSFLPSDISLSSHDDTSDIDVNILGKCYEREIFSLASDLSSSIHDYTSDADIDTLGKCYEREALSLMTSDSSSSHDGMGSGHNYLNNSLVSMVSGSLSPISQSKKASFVTHGDATYVGRLGKEYEREILSFKTSDLSSSNHDEMDNVDVDTLGKKYEREILSLVSSDIYLGECHLDAVNVEKLGKQYESEILALVSSSMLLKADDNVIKILAEQYEKEISLCVLGLIKEECLKLGSIDHYTNKPDEYFKVHPNEANSRINSSEEGKLHISFEGLVARRVKESQAQIGPISHELIKEDLSLSETESEESEQNGLKVSEDQSRLSDNLKEFRSIFDPNNTLSLIRTRLKNVLEFSYINMKTNAEGLIESPKIDISQSLPNITSETDEKPHLTRAEILILRSRRRNSHRKSVSFDHTAEEKHHKTSCAVPPPPKIELLPRPPKLNQETEMESQPAEIEISSKKLEFTSMPDLKQKLNETLFTLPTILNDNQNKNAPDIAIFINEEAFHSSVSTNSLDSNHDFDANNSPKPHEFIFQPLSLMTLAANVFFSDTKLEMFSQLMNTSESIKGFISNTNALDLDPLLKNKNGARCDFGHSLKSLSPESSLQHWYLANQKSFVRNSNDTYPSPISEDKFKTAYLKLTKNGSCPNSAAERSYSPIIMNSNVFHFPYRSNITNVVNRLENELYVNSTNTASTSHLYSSPLLSPEANCEENDTIVVKKVVPSPLTSRKFFICSVPNEYILKVDQERELGKITETALENSKSIGRLNENSANIYSFGSMNTVCDLEEGRPIPQPDANSMNISCLESMKRFSDLDANPIPQLDANSMNISSLESMKKISDLEDGKPNHQVCHLEDGKLIPQPGENSANISSLESMKKISDSKDVKPFDQPNKKLATENLINVYDTLDEENSSLCLANDPGNPCQMLCSSNVKNSGTLRENGDTNIIKENCSLKCTCGEYLYGDINVRVISVREKPDSPEIILRTWLERQDKIEEWKSPSPVTIPKWIEGKEINSSRLLQAFIKDTSSPGPLLEDKRRKESFQVDKSSPRKDEDLTQKDRSIEVYPETLRQRQRNMAPSPSKVDIKNWDPSCPSSISADEGKKFLPSVKALRSQFENVKSPGNLRKSSNSSTNSLVLSSLDTSSCFGSMTSSQFTFELASPATPSSKDSNSVDEAIEPIFRQFKDVDEELKEMMGKPPSTQGWNPHSLLKRIYYVPDAPKIQRREAPFVDIEGYLEKLPSGRKKATFWNAWKRRYFVAKDGMLYYYQNNQTEKPSMTLSIMGGKIEIMDANMVSLDDGGRESRNAGMFCIDDGKGHCVVVRCPSRQEAERWKEALETHTIDDYSTHYVQPWPHPTNPTLLRDTLVVDIGSCSVRAGVLASQPTLPQLFFPSVVATHRETNTQTWGIEALMPDVRSVSSVSFPIRPSHKISKFSVDLNAVSSLLQKTFSDLKVDPKDYNIQLSVPRVLNLHTQAELLKILFEKFGVKSVNMTHQAILALYAYNATSGVVVDIGERLDVVPVIDGYIVDGGVSRVPYGGYRIMDHLRQFLFQKNISLITEVDSYIIRQVLETICYCAQHYNTEKQRCTLNSEKFEKFALLTEFFPESDQYEIFRNITLDFGRFQTTEGLFNPEAWGLDHPGLHKLVHKAIQECSMDIRKEMSRSVFLSGGVTQLPGIVERLTIELDNLTPPAIRPKVHASPHRYHAAYLGACELAESLAFSQSKITKEEWIKQGNSALRKWAL